MKKNKLWPEVIPEISPAFLFSCPLSGSGSPVPPSCRTRMRRTAGCKTYPVSFDKVSILPEKMP